MKHPNQAALALHAGGDLGLIARWRTERHLKRCESCRDELATFESLREMLPDLGEIPEISWNRLAAEMRANIRLGLAAGECVRTADAPLRDHPLFTGARAIVAMASVIAVLAAGLLLEAPAPVMAETGRVLQTTRNGIQVRQGIKAFGLRNNAGNDNVTYAVGAQGSVSARYVDSDTGYVTINQVYAE